MQKFATNTTSQPALQSAGGDFTGAELPLISTKEQLAAVLRVSPKHIENLTARGLLRPVRLGRCVRYRRDAVLRALAVMEGSQS
jgi:excisionase family DNA binding protein